PQAQLASLLYPHDRIGDGRRGHRSGSVISRYRNLNSFDDAARLRLGCSESHTTGASISFAAVRFAKRRKLLRWNLIQLSPRTPSARILSVRWSISFSLFLPKSAPAYC